MMKDVEEFHQRRVMGMALPLARVLRHMQRNRPVGSEQAEEVDREFRGSFFPFVKLRQCGGRKRQGRYLSETHVVIARTQRLANARPLPKVAFDQPQRPEEVERKWLSGEPLDQIRCLLPG